MRTYVTDYLDAHGVAYAVKPHGRPVFTSEDAAEARGVRLSQIAKTMLVTAKGGRVLIAVLPGDRRLDLKKLRRAAHDTTLKLMNRKAIEQRFGLTVGALAPVGGPLEGLPVYMDPTVFDEELVDISSGDPSAGVELAGAELRRLLPQAVVTEIVATG